MLKRIAGRWLYWELWPFTLIYAPLGFLWMYYAVRARAFWFFSNVNPTLFFSGFEGETKKEMYAQLPENLYPRTLFISPTDRIEDLSCRVQRAGIIFPCISKPDIGTQGLMFRKLDNEEQLYHYHNSIGGDYMIQTLVDLPEEYSVFYIRYPHQKKGKITGLIKKDYLSVTGDGKSTLAQLIQHDERAKHRWNEMRIKHKDHLQERIGKGIKYVLSIAGNHNRGARFVNLHREIDESLCAVFDDIGRSVPKFYYGRYDLKCTSLADLKAGRNIQILEYNGTGAEPNHIYDCGMSYANALRVIQQHWKDLFQIGRINYKDGIQYWDFLKGHRHLQKTKDWYRILKNKDIHFSP